VTGDNSTTWTAWFMTSPGAVEVAADVRGQPPLFTIAYSPKTPQKWTLIEITDVVLGAHEIQTWTVKQINHVVGPRNPERVIRVSERASKTSQSVVFRVRSEPSEASS
jgi:hypothetical protein